MKQTRMISRMGSLSGMMRVRTHSHTQGLYTSYPLDRPSIPTCFAYSYTRSVGADGNEVLD